MHISFFQKLALRSRKFVAKLKCFNNAESPALDGGLMVVGLADKRFGDFSIESQSEHAVRYLSTAHLSEIGMHDIADTDQNAVSRRDKINIIMEESACILYVKDHLVTRCIFSSMRCLISSEQAKTTQPNIFDFSS